MKTKQLGNSDLFITPVGFGSWAIGGSGPANGSCPAIRVSPELAKIEPAVDFAWSE